MKKVFRSPIVLSFMAIALCGCEEDDSPIMFKTADNQNPENVKVEYYSPDPSCIGRSYHVTANSHAGELTMKCTNSNNLFFAEIPENSNAEYGLTESGDVDENTLVYENGSWSVSITENNCLKFVFDETYATPDEETAEVYDYVKVCTNKHNKTMTTSISVQRLIYEDTALN